MVWARGELCFLSAVAVIAEVCPPPPGVVVLGAPISPPCPGLGAPVSWVCPPPPMSWFWGPCVSPVTWFGGPCVSGLPPVSWFGGPCVSGLSPTPMSWFGGPCVSGLPPRSVSWFGGPCVSPLPSGVHDCCPGASSCGVRRGRGDLQSVVCLISPAPSPGARWEGSRGTRPSAGGGAPAKSYLCHVSS